MASRGWKGLSVTNNTVVADHKVATPLVPKSVVEQNSERVFYYVISVEHCRVFCTLWMAVLKEDLYRHFLCINCRVTQLTVF